MNIFPIRVAVSLVIAAAALSSCSTSGGLRSGGLLSSNTPSGSAVYITALQGGIVQRSGVDLSNSDRQHALEAEYQALEAAPGGQPVTWTGRQASGQVVAAAPYQVGAQNCRQYSHKVTVDGVEKQARGAACRNASGTWTPLT
ncbi:MAG: hypothetical protein ACOH2J_02660 [Allorhizobium sp.]